MRSNSFGGAAVFFLFFKGSTNGLRFLASRFHLPRRRFVVLPFGKGGNAANVQPDDMIFLFLKAADCIIRQEQVYTEAVNKCVKEMDRLMELKSGLYADYTEDLLDEKEYLQLNREYSQRIEKLKIQADEYRQAASQYESAEKTVAQLKAEMLRFKGNAS